MSRSHLHNRARHTRQGDEEGRSLPLRGPIPEHFDLHHLCEVPLCVNPDHLQPLSHGEHMRIGRQSKLSHEKAQKIKNLHAEGYSQRNLAEMFGVHSSQISRICSGKKWNPANDHTIRVSKPITEDEIIHPKIRQEHLICPQCGGHRAGRAYPVCRSCRSKAMRDKRPSDSQIYTVDGFACRKIVSSKYQWALLDTSRYDEISSEMWQAVWSDHSQKFYIGCARKNSATGKQQYYSMASIILRVPRGTSIGYVNGNTLDLRECNLYVKEKVLRSGGTRRNR